MPTISCLKRRWLSRLRFERQTALLWNSAVELVHDYSGFATGYGDNKHVVKYLPQLVGAPPEFGIAGDNQSAVPAFVALYESCYHPPEVLFFIIN